MPRIVSGLFVSLVLAGAWPCPAWASPFKFKTIDVPLQFLDIRYSPIALPGKTALAIAQTGAICMGRTGNRFVLIAAIVQGVQELREHRAVRLGAATAPSKGPVDSMNTGARVLQVPYQSGIQIGDRAGDLNSVPQRLAVWPRLLAIGKRSVLAPKRLMQREPARTT